MSSSRHYTALFAAIGTVWLVIWLANLYLTDGHLFYSLDDPYIHLRVAERIDAGEYGINTGEFTTPVSSIIWPYLLAPFAAHAWGYAAPLLINTLCLLGTAALLYRSLTRYSEKRAALITFLLLLLLNGIGVVFTGMEHSLQLLLSVAITTAMLDITEGRALPGWLPAALIAGPLVRYEMLTFSLGAIALLFLHRQYRYVWTLAVILMSVGLFSLVLWLMSGYPLPASIYAKLSLSVHEPLNFVTTAFAAVLLLLIMLRLRRERNLFLFCGFMLAALLAHLLFGGFGWFSRYEIYVLIPAVFTIIYFLPQSGLASKRELILFGCIALVFGFRYPATTLSSPAASAAIYGMHGQIQRLIKEANFPAMATNDIGYVSYHNPSYVMDIWGLGSIPVQHMRINDLPALLASAEEKNVRLVMMFPSLYGETLLPEGWVKLGTLELVKYPGLVQVIAEKKMDIYATSPEYAQWVLPVIAGWQNNLPASTRWVSAGS